MAADKHRKCKTAGKRWLRAGMYLLTALLLLGMAGSIYQWRGVQVDHRQFPPIGQLVDINGNRMHVYAQGEGELTIVMASGHGMENQLMNQPYLSE